MYGHIDDCTCGMCTSARAQGLHTLPPPPEPPEQEHHVWRPGGTPGNETARCRDCGEMPFTHAHMAGQMQLLGIDPVKMREKLASAPASLVEAAAAHFDGSALRRRRRARDKLD